MHAVNNLVGGPHLSPADLETACAQVVAETGESMADHATNTGWYSHSVLWRVLQETIPPRWRLRLSPMDTAEIFHFCEDNLIYQVLINQNGQHWTAVVKHAGILWHVDSCDVPRIILDNEFEELLCHHPETYPLLESEHPI